MLQIIIIQSGAFQVFFINAHSLGISDLAEFCHGLFRMFCQTLHERAYECRFSFCDKGRSLIQIRTPDKYMIDADPSALHKKRGKAPAHRRSVYSIQMTAKMVGHIRFDPAGFCLLRIKQSVSAVKSRIVYTENMKFL